MLLNNFIAFIIFKFNSNFTSQIFSRPMQINLTNFDAFKLTKRRGNSALIHILPPTSHQGILVFLLLSSFYFTTCQEDNVNLFPFVLSSFEKRYGHFDHEDLELARDQAREMFFFGYVRVFTSYHRLYDKELIWSLGTGIISNTRFLWTNLIQFRFCLYWRYDKSRIGFYFSAADVAPTIRILTIWT